MKLAIVGAGAMGSLFAFFFARTGKKVWLLDNNQERVEKVRNKGLKIEGISGEHTINVSITNNAFEIGKADLVLICVKAYDTLKAAKDAMPLVSEQTTILTVQNGLGNIEILDQVLGKEKILGGITSHGATVLGPGSVRHAGSGDTTIGELNGKITPRLNKIVSFLHNSGINASFTDDVEGLIWSKLIINVGINALTAITRLKNGQLIYVPEIRKILKLAVEEGLIIVKRKNIKLIYQNPFSKVEGVCTATASNVSSMLQDILNQKKTEVDFINGAIVREGELLGIPTPVNLLLLNLVKGLEKTHNIREG
ncbi:MAG: 2-dehydropantoate 2-reductase [Thermodesulfobacteriota bacterium]|nr:2-dehydropantoate 2-reductase [Thermodesulfobacteriota bacterium]